MLTLTPATSEPVTVEEAKAHLRVTHSADDALIGRLITAARESVEMQTGRALAGASYRSIASHGALPLWPANVDAVTSKWGGALLPVTEYELDEYSGVVTVRHADEIGIDFTTAPGIVPQALKDAILLRVQADYEDGADDAEKRREAAYRLAFPWRRNLGV